MLARELAIVLRARITWLAAALSALLVGHGFILAVDIYTASSRSARANVLQARELDPLLGIVRPSLGGLYLAISLLGALVAARAIAVEKERHTLAPLLLQTASPVRVVLAKFGAACAGMFLQAFAPLALLVIFRAAGGHLAWAETATAIFAFVLYMIVITALATAAASWTQTFAQAAATTILLVAASWAIDASEGFAALAWLGRVLDWSVTTHLEPLERGTLAIGAILWMLAVAAGALAMAVVGIRFDLSRPRRAAWTAGVLLSTIVAGLGAHRVRLAFDETELSRASLPPGAVRGLRDIAAPISVDVYLDREDSRRRQLESDVLAKLRLARPDVRIRMPLDERDGLEGAREDDYGRIDIAVGGERRSTLSAGRRELVTLIFEAAGRPAPDWWQPAYDGYPLVIEGARRKVVGFLAYAGLPLLLAGFGGFITHSRRRRS